MKADDLKAKNLLLRLTNLAVTYDSRRLENYCTEVLAWCCHVSHAFQKELIRSFKMPEGEYDVHTQYSAKCSRSNADSLGRQVYFDLLFENAKAVLVVEVKTWSNFRENQLRDYEAAADLAFNERLPKIATITPFAGLPAGSKQNISWGKIHELLQNTSSDMDGKTPSIFRQFAQFLDEHELGNMNLDQVTSTNIQSLIAAAPMCGQLFDLMRGLGKNPKVAPLFDKGLDKPFFEYNEEHKRSWIGIKSERVPEYHAAISLSGHRQDPTISLWVCVMVLGAYASYKLPDGLCSSFEEATRLLPSDDQSANFGKSKEGCTWFNFANSLTGDLAARPWDTLAWFEDTLLQLKSFVETLPA